MTSIGPTLWLLATIGFISQVGISVMLPLLPLYATELGELADMREVEDPFVEIEALRAQYRVPEVPGLPGFTGGLAYVLDIERDFVDHYNHELIDILRIAGDGMENYRSHLRDLLTAHAAHTGSAWASKILDEMRDFLGKFWLVKPKAASLEALAENLRRAA